MSNSMPVPEWAKDASNQLSKAYEGVDHSKSKTFVRDLTPVDIFSSHFAEYEIKKNDLLIHLFPRKGKEDRWYPESYNDKGVYIPGRREVKAENCSFPTDMRDRIKKASDSIWQGSVAIEAVPELGAFVVQFQNAKNTAAILGKEKFVDRFCEGIDEALEQK